MSTSMLVERIKTAAKEREVEIDIYALGEAEAKKDLAQADILLLGPQVRYLENGFRKELAGKNTKLAVIDMVAYGRMNGEKVLEQIHTLRFKPNGIEPGCKRVKVLR